MRGTGNQAVFFLEVFKNRIVPQADSLQAPPALWGDSMRPEALAWDFNARGWIAGLAHQQWVLNSQEERIGLVWVGDIFNIKEVARRVSLAADTALGGVLATVYRRLGVQGFGLLEGDFSLGMWLPAENRLIAVRDGMGSHLLYYHQSEVSWILSNEAFLVAHAVESSPQLSTRSLLMWACNSYDEMLPLFEKVQGVQRGTALEMVENRLQTTPFWSLVEAPPVRLPKLEDYVEKLGEVLGRCIEDRCKRGSSALMLSGGMDSAVLATLAFKKDPELLALTYQSEVQQDCNEWVPAQQLADFLGMDLRALDADQEWLLKGMAQAPPSPDPFFSWNSLTEVSFSLMQSKSKCILLTGHGGDSLFSGLSLPLIKGLSLNWRAWRDWRECQMAWRERGFSDWRGVYRYLVRPRIRRAVARRKKWPFRFSWIPRGVCHRHFPDGFPWRGSDKLPEDLVRREILQRIDGDNSGIRRAIHWFHRMARPHQVSVRHPLFDKRLAEFVVGVPPEVLRAKHEKKGLLAEVLRKSLPEELVQSRGKPSLAGLYGYGLHREQEWIVQTLRQSQLVSRGLVSWDKLHAEMRRYYLADPAVALAWFLPTFSTELWLQKAIASGCRWE